MHPVDRLRNLVFGDTGRCLLCHAPAKPNGWLCADCQGDVHRHLHTVCTVCGRQSLTPICSLCQAHPRPYDRGGIVYVYEDHIRRMMHDFKEDAQGVYGSFFADGMVQYMMDRDWPVFDCVTAVPAHAGRTLLRLYHPAARLGRQVARQIRRPYSAHCLRRVGHGRAMRRANVNQRMDQAGVHYAPGRDAVLHQHVLLVDDVSTSGATLHVCAQILKDQGAASVHVLAAAGAIAL